MAWDARALKILKAVHGTYPPVKPSASDFAYAKEKGLMFEPRTLTHDQACAWLIASVKKVKLRQASDAFLASLTTRRLEWRVAFAAYAVGRHFAKHTFRRDDRGECAVCGWDKGDAKADLSDFNHGRIVHGSIYGLKIAELAFVLERFAEEIKTDAPKPTKADVDALNKFFQLIRDVQRVSTDGRAHRAECENGLGKIVKSDKYERQHIFDALGFAGLLCPPELESYRARWLPPDDRGGGDSANGETEHPVNSWHASHGINTDAQREWFPQPGIEVVEVAPPVIQKGLPPDLKKLHPALGEVLGAMRPEKRPPPPYHAGGPPPAVDAKKLFEIARGWIPLVVPHVPAANKELVDDALAIIAGKKKYERGIGWWLKKEKAPAAAAVGFILELLDTHPGQLARSSGSGTRRVAQVLEQTGGDTAKLARELDQALMKAELDRPGVVEVLHRAKGFTLARLDGKNKFGVLLRGTWSTGSRDEILASLPDDQFAAGVEKALKG
jgi:hypothetical protein